MPRTSSSASKSREQRERERARRDRAHEKYVQKTYGLQPGEYAQRLADQGGRCAICGRQPRARRLAVDHDHNTGEPRALLCYTCNKALGWWEFDPIAAHNAALYLASIAAAYGPIYDPLPRPHVEPGGTANRAVRLPPRRAA